MIEYVVEKLMAWCERQGRVLKITGTAGPDDVYLIRYYLIRSKYFNLFIHQFLRSDRDDLHDHPWHFATYLVRGKYTEYKWDESRGCAISTEREANVVTHHPYKDTYLSNANRLVFRKATDQHQVVVPVEYKERDKHLAALTVCVTGPTIREWGFVREYGADCTCWDGITIWDGTTEIGCKLCDRGHRLERVWVPWREYLGLAPDAPGRG